MLNFSIIVAMSHNRAIGNDNKLLWHLPNDLQHFKKITMGKPIVMGRKTFESIGKPLPGRENIILSNSVHLSSLFNLSELYNPQDLKVFTDINKLLNYFTVDTEVMVIGGGQIYKQFLDKANKIYLTLVDAVCDADVYFPELDDNWVVVSKQSHSKDAKHQYNYQFIELIKKFN
jgi:dihydrofolate reductase